MNIKLSAHPYNPYNPYCPYNGCAVIRVGGRKSQTNKSSTTARLVCYSFPFSAESSPQAALISSPREARMVVIMPRCVSASRKAIIFSSEGEKYGESGILWNRIRLMRHLMPSSRRHNSLMCRGESFKPLFTIYSNDTRRW